jgi:hypothetical protein
MDRLEINKRISAALKGKKHEFRHHKSISSEHKELIRTANIEKQRLLHIEYIIRWKNGLEKGNKGLFGTSNYIRKYLLDVYNHKCSKCGWCEINPFTRHIPLEIHHKDGNSLNRSENNLELLCPNCHSLTENHGSRNKNNCHDRNGNLFGS